MIIDIKNYQKVYGAKQCNIDTMQLQGYKLVKEFFVDSSGFGASNESALTKSDFEIELVGFLLKYGKPVTAKITSVGQFQVYVGLFEKTGKKISRKIGNNTYAIDYGNGKTAIRLHNTDVLTSQDGKITLNTDGWQTVTTKDRINKYLPSGVFINQKNYEWFLNVDGKTIEYTDGITVDGRLAVV